MKKDLKFTFTGWAFICSAVLLFGGWELLPHHIGEYFQTTDFAAVNENFWFWVWMYRFHIFGWVIMGAAMIAFAAITFDMPYRTLVLPGAGVVIVGTFVSALATAFYYTFGAWGIGQTEGFNELQIQEFIDERMSVANHYVTCLVRFGRIFAGAGFVLLTAGLLKWNIVPKWLSIYTLLMGMAAMCIILFIPENFDIYKPVFYVKVGWLLLMGYTILKNGLNLSESSD